MKCFRLLGRDVGTSRVRVSLLLGLLIVSPELILINVDRKA